MDNGRSNGDCGPECRDLDPREPRDSLHNDSKQDDQIGGSCVCSRGSSSSSAPAVALEGGASGSCSQSACSKGGSTPAGVRQPGTGALVPGDSSNEKYNGSASSDALTTSLTPPAVPVCAGGGASRIRRLLRGRAHSSHGATSSGSSNNGASAEEKHPKGQPVGSSRERTKNIPGGRPAASKSTSSLLDASSTSGQSSSCCGTTISGSAIWSVGSAFHSEAFSLGHVPPAANQQLQSASSPSTSSNQTTPSANASHKTKNKVGSWALKLCKRGTPGGSSSSNATGAAQASPAGNLTASSYCAAGTSGSGASSKSTNSSPSKGPAPLGYSGCHQGGLSASLPLASSPSENAHNRYHCHHDSGSSASTNNEFLCICCTAGTSRDPAASNCGVCGVSSTFSSGTPNATRRRMATAIINQLSSASSAIGAGEGAPPSQGGSDDLDERARIERAREIAEGVDPPPGFIRAHEVIPDEIAAALRSLNLDALPWDVLGKIWDLNPSPHQIPLSLGPAATSSHGNSSATTASGAGSNAWAGTTVHTTVDYMHCLVPDLAQISRCGFYWGKMDRYEAERLLQKKPEGSFLLRDSAQEEYLFSVSFRRYGRSLHARIEQWNHNFSFDSHDPGVFSSPTVCGLIEHYKDPACCMYFEPMLTIPINRNFPFSLQHLSRCAITERVSYDEVSRLHLPKPIKAYLREYHYKQRLRVRNMEKE